MPVRLGVFGRRVRLNGRSLLRYLVWVGTLPLLLIFESQERKYPAILEKLYNWGKGRMGVEELGGNVRNLIRV